MVQQDQNSKKVSEQEKLLKSVQPKMAAFANADIINIQNKEDTTVIEVYGPSTEGDDLYRITINTENAEVIGDSIMSQEDIQQIKAIDEANNEAFRQAMKADETILFEAIVSKVKSLWN